MKYRFLFAAFSLILTGATAAQSMTTVTFQVDMNREPNAVRAAGTIGVRGSLAPLNWERTYPLSDPDGDGIFTAEITFPHNGTEAVLEYKYVYGDVVWELDGADNRLALLDGRAQNLPVEQWDRARPLTEAIVQRLSNHPAAALREDLAILKQALKTLHPGLYRYNEEADIDRSFEALEAEVTGGMDTPTFYAALSELLARIRCGHTYANPYNQPGLVRQLVFERADKLPFTFRIVDRRMIVTGNASDDERFQRGTEILQIGDVPVATLLGRTMRLVKADGGNDGKRLYDLQVRGYAEFESFDIYFPLLFPPKKGEYHITAKPYGAEKAFAATVKTVDRATRRARLEARYGPLPKRYEDLWQFEVLDAQTAYLRLGTFVTWNMEMDWKAFLKDTFKKLEKEEIPHLILDIRGNEGGADEVIEELGKYLVKRSVTLEGTKSLLRYQRVPDALRPYLGTWDETYFDISAQVEAAGDGYYRQKGDDFGPLELPAGKRAYKGKVFLLIDAGNSSATFLLSRMARESGAATLVGQKTGGSLRGINGGMMFMLRLPNSRIEVDIPLIGTFPLGEQPDRGLQPDIPVAPNVDDIARGVDTELEAVLEFIRKGE